MRHVINQSIAAAALRNTVAAPVQAVITGNALTDNALSPNALGGNALNAQPLVQTPATNVGRSLGGRVVAIELIAPLRAD